MNKNQTNLCNSSTIVTQQFWSLKNRHLAEILPFNLKTLSAGGVFPVSCFLSPVCLDLVDGCLLTAPK